MKTTFASYTILWSHQQEKNNSYLTLWLSMFFFNLGMLGTLCFWSAFPPPPNRIWAEYVKIHRIQESWGRCYGPFGSFITYKHFKYIPDTCWTTIWALAKGLVKGWTGSKYRTFPEAAEKQILQVHSQLEDCISYYVHRLKRQSSPALLFHW